MTTSKKLWLFLAMAVGAVAQTPQSINFTANAALVGTTSFAFSGTGSISGLGNATLSGAGAFDASLLSGQGAGILPGTFTLIFTDGAAMFGTFDIPTAILVPQIGGAVTTTGSITIQGGTGRFEGARGVFASLTGTGTATSASSASVVVNGTGNVSAGQYVLPQFVAGGGWYTALYFSNSRTTPVTITVDLTFVGDNGAPLPAPQGRTSTNVTIPASGSVLIEGLNSGALRQGYASTTLPPGVTGYGVFRQTVAGTPDQEAVVPLSNAASTFASFLFDDTNFTTAAAIVNTSSVDTTVTITATSPNGGALGTATISLPAKNKTAVALRTIPGMAGIAGRRGTVSFSVTTGNVSVLGLRFFGSAFTSIPAVDR